MDEFELKKCLWLNCLCGHSPGLIEKCVTVCGSAQELYDGKADEKTLKKVLGSAYSEYRKKDLSEASELIERCRRENIRIIHISDPEYPQLLKNTFLPPQILYAKGKNINLNEYLTVSVVGTRRASRDGMEFARTLCNDIAKAGIVVVSGMAKGLDAQAHLGALGAGQLTVAVLAGGVDIVYPKENGELYERILKQGIVLSERPPGMIGRDYFYQERNRIIAGMSYGVVITEGHKGSGTSITVRHAQDYNRDIFAVPGKPTDENAYIPNALIHDGAVTTLSADDVIVEYEGRFGELLDNGIAALRDGQDVIPEPAADKKKPIQEKPANEPDFSQYMPKERKILEFLFKHGEHVHIDEIIRNTELKPSDVNSAVVLLQLKGIIRQHAGNLYSLEVNGG